MFGHFLHTAHLLTVMLTLTEDVITVLQLLVKQNEVFYVKNSLINW
jgi:hypothetical protein